MNTVRTARPIHRHENFYLGGRWIPATGAARLEVIDPATEQVIGAVPEGTAADVDVAVRAAAAVAADWGATDVATRAGWLETIAEALQDRADDLAELITTEVGTPLWMSAAVQVGLPLQTLRATAHTVRAMEFEQDVGGSLIVREPVGVVAALTAWNYPLHQVTAKVAAALAAGCPVVLKPSELAPLSAFAFAEVLHEVGLPAGVVNLVSGTGRVTGDALVRHPLVDMATFTGSTDTGRRIAAQAAAGVKRVALELGGKSPAVLLPDADLARAVPDVVKKAMRNSGQTCFALSRLIVPRERLAEVEALAVRAAGRLPVGDPLAGRVYLGPLVSHAQRERVRQYIRSGLEQGARLLLGGLDPPDGLASGYYLRPTVFSGTTGQMTIVREEIFGPVLVIQAYGDEAEAVQLANDTDYGLAAAVWSADPARALAVARRLRAGQVEINGAPFDPQAPFGGVKQSGIGREGGRHGIEEFLETKAIQR